LSDNSESSTNLDIVRAPIIAEPQTIGTNPARPVSAIPSRRNRSAAALIIRCLASAASVL